MRTRESIRNRVINYVTTIWNTKRVDNMHPLIHLMIEEVCNELYLMDNKLNDIDSTILDNLVRRITPAHFDYVRPASTIIHIRPDRKQFRLTDKSEFFIKEVPDYIRQKYISSVVFSPLVDVNLSNLSIAHIYINQKLSKVDELGNKQLIATSNQKQKDNNLWIQLNNPQNITQIKDLYFYLDFPHLNDNHEYYDILSNIEWKAESKVLNIKNGLPNISNKLPSKVEANMLEYYKVHFYTIVNTLHIGKEAYRSIPEELALVLGGDICRGIPDGYWIKIKFPSYFSENDLDNIQLLLNAFPALNRRSVEHRQIEDAFSGVVALPSEIGEEFLEIENVVDSNRNFYSVGDISTKNSNGFYTLEPIKKKEINDVRIHDYLELFLDVLERERTAFPKMDRDKIGQIRNALSSFLEDETKRVKINLLNDYAEVARLEVAPMENSSHIDFLYWTTLAEAVNGLPAKTPLMANKITALNKSEATLVTTVHGGRVLYDLDCLKAINRFYMTSRGRILTKHDILSFCQIEVGKYAFHLDVVRCAKISSKPRQGIINAMEVQITPKKEYLDILNQKEILRELKIKLSKYSPSNYNYVVKLIN